MCAHENKAGRYVSVRAFVKNFFKCDSISTNPARGGGPVRNGPILQEDSLHIAICVHPNAVVGFDNL